MAKNLSNFVLLSWKLDNPYYHNQKILKRILPRKWCWHWKGWYLQITIFQIYMTLRTSSRERAHCKYFLFTMFNANNVSVFWHLARHFSVSSSFNFSTNKVSAQEPSFRFTWLGPSKAETMWKFSSGLSHFCTSKSFFRVYWFLELSEVQKYKRLLTKEFSNFHIVSS